MCVTLLGLRIFQWLTRFLRKTYNLVSGLYKVDQSCNQRN